MLKRFVKYKDFFKDIFFNTLSFFIYICAQQLIYMPFMSRFLSESQYAIFVIFISVFSVLTNALGNELGIVSQVINRPVNFSRLLLKISLSSFVIICALLLYLGFDWSESLILGVATFLANYRLFSGGIFRSQGAFKKVLLLNFLYLNGILFGLLLIQVIPLFWLPMVLAETITFSYCVSSQKLFHFNEVVATGEETEMFINYSMISFFNNLITYIDKFLVLPFLGALSLNVYYATTSMSKIVNLVINPLHGVLLRWIKKDSTSEILIKRFIYSSIPIVLVSSILSVPFTYISIKILYPKYLEHSLSLLLPVSIALGVSVGTSILKSLLMKFIDSRELTKIYFIYFFIFIVSAIITSTQYGLVAFAYSVFFSKAFLYGGFLFYLRKVLESEACGK
ncbi:TPA: hypothetical protein ACGO7R_001844 [Streptococcus suis]|nr:hypothetical protein [Streptococcus suis]